MKFQIQLMVLLFCKTNNCSHDHTNSLYKDFKTVYKFIKYKTNCLHSTGYSAVIN